MSDEAKTIETTEYFEILPATDVVDTETGAEIYFEVPGANSKSVEVEVNDRILSVSAKSSLKRRGLPVVYKREFQLSDAVDVEKISARTADGVLSLFLPKSEKARVHKIAVG